MSTRKICLWAVPVVVVVAGAVWFFFFKDHHQIIKFSDDSKVTLLGVDYGKRHMPPTVKTATGARARRGGTFNTTNDTLVLWIQQEYNSKDWHNFEYYISDKAGTACVQSYIANRSGGRNGNETVGIRLDAFPRRQGKFYVRVQESGNGFTEMSEKKFVVSNPGGRSFAKWTPESLPTAKDDQDISVTLTKAVAGAQMPYNRGDSDAEDVMNKGVELALHIERNGKPASNWQPVSIVTSDATGNSIGGWVARNDWNDGIDTVMYQWGLWPDEPAWKIRMELSQQSDFADYELWTVSNVPFEKGRQQDFWNYNSRTANTNHIIAETELNGIHLKLFPAKEFTDVGPNSQPQGGLILQSDSDLQGMRMTVKIKDDHDYDIGFWDSGTSRNANVTTHRYSLRELSDSTNLTVSVALHKSRFVEFTVKPQKASGAEQ